MRTGWNWLGSVAAALGLLLVGCGKPDVTALQRIGCEQAAATVDLQSVKQLDALRKALGVAPQVDPVAYCESIGASMGVPKDQGDAKEP